MLLRSSLVHKLVPIQEDLTELLGELTAEPLFQSEKERVKQGWIPSDNNTAEWFFQLASSFQRDLQKLIFDGMALVESEEKAAFDLSASYSEPPKAKRILVGLLSRAALAVVSVLGPQVEVAVSAASAVRSISTNCMTLAEAVEADSELQKMRGSYVGTGKALWNTVKRVSSSDSLKGAIASYYADDRPALEAQIQDLRDEVLQKLQNDELFVSEDSSEKAETCGSGLFRSFQRGIYRVCSESSTG